MIGGSIDSVLDGRKLVSVLFDGSIFDDSVLEGGNLVDNSIESVLEDRERDSRSIDAGLDDCKSDSTLVDESIDSVLDGITLDSVLVLVNR